MQKTRRFTFSIGLLGLFGVLAVFIFSTHLYVQAQAGAIEVQGATAVNIGTAISYQGGLNQGGNPANGSFNFEFRLYDAVTGGTQIGSTGIHNGVVVTNGIFTITDLDFGSGAFNGEARFLAITVDGTLLAPRQELTPVPYALALPGLWTQQNGISPNLIGGHSNNQVASGIVGATIGGGGSATDLNTVTADYGTVGGGQNNSVSGGHSTVGGGVDNSASGFGATIGGGDSNDVSQQGATVGGGQDNSASRGFATVGGGNENIASGETSTVGGGGDNTASGDYATVGGGESNVASGSIATVPGGSQNIAEGDASFAAGQRAHAQHDGSFVWGDNSTTLTVASSAANQFVVRAAGGTTFYSNSGATSGVTLASGSGAWSSLSDRNAKENVEEVNGRFILNRLADIPITTWNYKTQADDIRHMGPMAQDFEAAFSLGEDNTRINTLDADGVGLAAIQGLYEIVQEQEAQIADLETRLQALEPASRLQKSDLSSFNNLFLLGGFGLVGLLIDFRRRQGESA